MEINTTIEIHDPTLILDNIVVNSQIEPITKDNKIAEEVKEEIKEVIEEIEEDSEIVEDVNLNPVEEIDYNDTECSICLESLNIGNISQLNCKQKGASDNHWFHQACIKEWLKNSIKIFSDANEQNRYKLKSQTCPICRTGNKILITVPDDSGNQPLCELTYKDPIFESELLSAYHQHPDRYPREISDVINQQRRLRVDNLSDYRPAYVSREDWEQANATISENLSERSRGRRRRDNGLCNIL